MASRTVRVTVEVPEGTPDATREVVQNRAQEAAVLALWESERLSTREAAEELGLDSGAFLDLLAARGIPMADNTLDARTSEEARQGHATAQDSLDARLSCWQAQDGIVLAHDTPSQALFAQWAAEDALMSDEERESEDRLWESVHQSMNATRAALGMRRL